MGTLSKTTLQCISEGLMHCRRIVSRDHGTKVHEIWGISFDWPDPQNAVKLCRALTNMREMSVHPLWKNFAL